MFSSAAVGRVGKGAGDLRARGAGQGRGTPRATLAVRGSARQATTLPAQSRLGPPDHGELCPVRVTAQPA